MYNDTAFTGFEDLYKYYKKKKQNTWIRVFNSRIQNSLFDKIILCRIEFV